MNTEIKITKIENPTTNLLAYVSLTLNNEICITGIKILQNTKDNSLFVSMPARKGKNKDGEETYFDVCYPISKEAREKYTSLILAEYQR